MKYLLAAFFTITLCYCASKKEIDIIGLSQAYLKDQMKDPASFQVIKSEIVDTTMISEHLKYQYTKDTLDIERIKIENELSLLRQGFKKGEETEKAEFEKILINKLAVYEATANRHLNALNNLKHDSVYCITVKFEYRAKNSFGALDKESKDVQFFPGAKSFKLVD